jgi:hypothetical protein
MTVTETTPGLGVVAPIRMGQEVETLLQRWMKRHRKKR